MMSRVIETALKEHKADELRANIEGVRRLYAEMANTINKFRDSKDLTEDKALALYEHAFQVKRSHSHLV